MRRTISELGLLEELTRADGVALSVTHNGSGQITAIALPDPDGGGPLAAPEAAFEYDANGIVSSVTSPGGEERTPGLRPLLGEPTGLRPSHPGNGYASVE